MKLSGWKRLWIVLSLVYTLAVLVYVFVNLPTPVSLLEYERDPRLKFQTRYDRLTMMKSGKKLPTSNYKAYKELVRTKQQQFIIKVTLFWLIPIALLYVAGWSIGWIYRGFKKQ